IKHCMGIISKICSFFNTAKRNFLLQEEIKADLSRESTHFKLKQLCATRWSERHDSVSIFLELFDYILSALHKISSTWDSSETSSTAFCLLTSMKSMEFIIALLTINRVFDFSSNLCKYLQSPKIDLCEAISYAKIVTQRVNEIRENVDVEFETLYAKASAYAEKYEIEIKVPRLAIQRSISPITYYKSNIFINFLDHFIMQMNERFLIHEQLLSSFQFLLAPSPLDQHNLHLLKNILQTYEADLQCNIEGLMNEYEIWHKRVEMLKRPLKNVEDALNNCNPIICENIFIILRIFATLPVSTCENERSFSMLRRLKTYLRSTTSENRLNRLALMNLYTDLMPSVEDVLDEMAKTNLKVLI
ncbi:52 kDa repressor of the inhibitor of the protein kinase, partial [Cyphomyrmex costatus]